MKDDKNKTIDYRNLFEDYITQIRYQIESGADRDFDAPSVLYSTQRRALKSISETPEEIKKELENIIMRLESLCKEAREEVAKVPDGDAWLEMWK